MVSPLARPLLLAADATVEIPAPARPGYLERWIDPTFGSIVTRITGDPGTRIPNIDGTWDAVARHKYSKDAAWNSDQTLLCLARHHGYPSVLILDGRTYEPLFGHNRVPGNELRWHPERPDIMVYVADRALGYWNVRTNKTEPLAEFPGYTKLHLGPYEGNLSRRGDLVVLNGLRAGESVAFAYELQTGRRWPDLHLNASKLDWVSVSPSGRFIVLNGTVDGRHADQTQIYHLDGTRAGEPWAESGRPSHYDLTIDADGEDVAVGVSKSAPDEGRVIARRLRDGRVTVLTSGGYASHTSARNVQRPGWVYVAYQHRNPAWPPYWDEVVAVKLDGSQAVMRIAHLQSRCVDYHSEAHAVPSPDGRRVLWASNWNAPTGRPVGAYVAHLPESF